MLSSRRDDSERRQLVLDKMKCREGRVKLEVRLAVNQGSVIPCPYRAAGPSLFARLPLLIPGSPSSSKFHCHSHVVETLIIVIAL